LCPSPSFPGGDETKGFAFLPSSPLPSDAREGDQLFCPPFLLFFSRDQSIGKIKQHSPLPLFLSPPCSVKEAESLCDSVSFSFFFPAWLLKHILFFSFSQVAINSGLTFSSFPFLRDPGSGNKSILMASFLPRSRFRSWGCPSFHFFPFFLLSDQPLQKRKRVTRFPFPFPFSPSSRP